MPPGVGWLQFEESLSTIESHDVRTQSGEANIHSTALRPDCSVGLLKKEADIFFQHRRSNWRDAHLRARRIRTRERLTGLRGLRCDVSGAAKSISSAGYESYSVRCRV